MDPGKATQLPTPTLTDKEERWVLGYFTCPESSGIMTAIHNSLPLAHPAKAEE